MSRIKILHIIWSGKMGGMEMVVYSLCLAQQRNKELESAVMICRSDDMEEIYEYFVSAPFKIYYPKLSSGHDVNLSKYKNLKQIFSQYDILQIHSYNPMIAYAAKRSGKKIICSIHGNFGFGRARKKSELFLDKMYSGFMNKHASFIFFNSEFCKKISEERFGLQKVNRAVIYNGIDFSLMKPLESDVDKNIIEKIKDKFVVGSAGRFADVKRFDKLIKTFAEFQKGKNAFLLLIGDGFLRNEYEKLISDLGIHDKVFITGIVKGARNYEQLIDLFVIPSFKESFGLVTIEAFSLGKPALAYIDGGGLVEIIGGMEKEDIVKTDDEMLNRMNNYFYHNNFITDKINERISYAKKFDIEIMQEKIFDHYRSLFTNQPVHQI